MHITDWNASNSPQRDLSWEGELKDVTSHLGDRRCYEDVISTRRSIDLVCYSDCKLIQVGSGEHLRGHSRSHTLHRVSVLVSRTYLEGARDSCGPRITEPTALDLKRACSRGVGIGQKGIGNEDNDVGGCLLGLHLCRGNGRVWISRNRV